MRKDRALADYLRPALSYLALGLFALFAIYPITQIITIALRPGDQLLSTSLSPIPKGATLTNVRILLTETPFLRWLGNSTLIAFAVTLTGVARASTAGYAVSGLSSGAANPDISSSDKRLAKSAG